MVDISYTIVGIMSPEFQTSFRRWRDQFWTPHVRPGIRELELPASSIRRAHARVRRDGEQQITITVPTRPARAGIAPRSLLIDVKASDNVGATTPASTSSGILEGIGMPDRSQYRVRRISLADEASPDLRTTTPAERLAMVWQLTLQTWMFKNGRWHEPRLSRHVVRIIRGRR